MPGNDASWNGHTTAQPSMQHAASSSQHSHLHQPRAAMIHRGPSAKPSCTSQQYTIDQGALPIQLPTEQDSRSETRPTLRDHIKPQYTLHSTVRLQTCLLWLSL